MSKLKAKYFNKKAIKEFLLINLGIFLAALSCALFLDPYNLIIGGVTGMGIILKGFFEVETYIIIFFLNLILLALSFLLLGKSFFIKTIYGSIMYPVYIGLIEIVLRYIPKDNWELVADDKFLLIIVAAIFMGAGLGLAMKYGASTGGTDILQYTLLKYWRLPLSWGLILTDGVIVIIGSILQGTGALATMLYGAIFICISGYVLDNIVFGGFGARSVYIISNKSEEIKQKIFAVLGRGITEISSRGGYTQNERQMLLCVMMTREYYTLRNIVKEIDPSAFIFVSKAAEVHGEGFTYESPSA